MYFYFLLPIVCCPFLMIDSTIMLFKHLTKDKTKTLQRHDFLFFSRTEYLFTSYIEEIENELESYKQELKDCQFYNKNQINLSESDFSKLDRLQIELENIQNYYNLCKNHIVIIKENVNYKFFEFFKLFRNFNEAEGAIIHAP